MKVYLIKASSGSSYSEYKAETGGPAQNIFSVAAATSNNVEIDMVDETIGMKADTNSDADIVAIFMSTPDAIRAYKLAEKFKKKGKVIVLGGLHTKFMEEEASKYSDALLIGEVEEIWEELLTDYRLGKLKKRYERKEAFDLSKLNPYPTDIISPEEYNWTWSVVVSRGCPNNCAFCLVHKFFNKYQFRPIENIVSEIRNLKDLGVEWVELHADNLTANRQYALELFKALAPLKMKFYGETTVLIANDTELLEAAKDAGIKALLFGIETPSEDALKEQGKNFVRPEKIKKYIEIVKSYGIEVWGDFLFGFDAHKPEIFEETFEFIKEINIDRAFPHMVIPFPGSETFNNLDKEGRILTKDWSKYDGTHVVYQPKKMTRKELLNGVYWVWQEYESFSKKKPENRKFNASLASVTWKTYLALIIIALSFYFNFYNIIFGLLFLNWSISALRNKQTYVVETIYCEKNPILFWVISTTWLVLSLWSFYY
jgi:radical SAM superfamily enzyme YgiQ (UPF0313 family)